MRNYSKSIFLLFAAFVIFSTGNHLSGQKLLWQKALGGTGYDQGMKMVKTEDNCFILGGSSASSDKYAKGNHAVGSNDIFIMKVSATGHVIWTTMLGGTGMDDFGDMILMPDQGVMVIGTSASTDGDAVGNHGKMDLFVARLDRLGKKQFSKCYGGSGNDKGTAILRTSDGTIYIGGESGSRNGDMDMAKGGLDSWVAILDKDYNIVQQRSFGCKGNERVTHLMELPKKEILVVNTATAQCGDVKANLGQADVWMFVLSKNWDFVWQRNFGGSDYDEPHRIIQTRSGDLVVAGTTHSDDKNNSSADYHGLGDSWLFCIDIYGELKWSECYGGSKSEGGNGVAQTPDGGFVLVGCSNSRDRYVPVNKGLYDGWIVRTDSMGKMIWSGTFGGEDFEYLYDVFPLPDGNYLGLGFAESVKGDLARIPNKDYGNDFWFIKFTDPKDPTDHPFDSRPYLTGRTTVKGTNTPIPAEILITNNDSMSISKKVYADPNTGIYYVPLPMEGKYSVMVTAPGFMFHGQDLDLTTLTENPEIRLDVELDPIEVGSKVILSNIYFQTGAWEIEDESAPELARLKYFLDMNKDIKVEISGHTDNTGNVEQKKELSLRRAESVRDKMLKSAVSGRNMQVEGYGMDRPVADNATQEGRAKNRRVEVEVVEILRR